MTLRELPQNVSDEFRRLNDDVYNPAKPVEKSVKRSKYGNKRTMYNGVMYDSQGEARRAQELDFEVQAGTVLWWARQPRFVLQGGVEYVADFIVQRTGGVVEVEDFKGMRTASYRLKKKQVEARYKVKIMEVA